MESSSFFSPPTLNPKLKYLGSLILVMVIFVVITFLDLNLTGNGNCDSHCASHHEAISRTNEDANLTATSGGANENERCDPQNFLVLIKAGSKAKYQQRRKTWRNSTCPTTYKKYKMPYRFMLAMPAHETIDPNGHNQGKTASHEEIMDMGKIRNESVVHKDMEFLALKDVYDDSNLKVIRMLEWAMDRGMTDATSMVVIHDDEYCLNATVLQRICENVTHSSLYAGSYLWETAGYDQQKQFDGTFAPYFSGAMEVLSSDLVRDIASDPDTLFTSMHMGYAEDLQMGKWVQNQANRKDNHPRQIKYVTDGSLLWNPVEEDK